MRDAETVNKASENVHAPLKSRPPGIDLIDSHDKKEGPKFVARAPIARRFTPHFPVKRSMAVEFDDADDAENSKLVQNQIINESNRLVDSGPESEERVDLLRQPQIQSSVNLPAQGTPIKKPVFPNLRSQTKVTAYVHESSGSTTETDSDLLASRLVRQPQPQAQPHKKSCQSRDRFRQYNDAINNDSQPRQQRYRKQSQRKISSSDDDNDNHPSRSQINKKNRLSIGYSRGPDASEENDNDAKRVSRAGALLRKPQEKSLDKTLPPKQAPTSRKIVLPSSNKPPNSISSEQPSTPTRSSFGRLIKRTDRATPPTNTVPQSPSSLQNTLLSPSKNPSMTSPFPGPRPRRAVKKARLGS